MSARAEVLERIRSLPALPAAALRAMQLLRDPEAEIPAIVRAVEYDPGLTANVLRRANGVSSGASRRISSLRDAVARLGVTQVYQLVVAGVVGPLARAPIPAYDLAGGALWEHSVAVAVCTRSLRAELDLPPCEEAFTAGLLHDVGKLVLGTFAGGEPGGIEVEDESLYPEEEERRCGMSHAEAGAALLKHWGLPSDIVEAVRQHHDPASGSPLICRLVHLADALCLSMGMGGGRDGLRYAVSALAGDGWGLDRRSIERVMMRTLAELDEAREAFGAPSGR